MRIIGILMLLLVAGCVSNYQYDQVNYSSRDQAISAAKADMDRQLAGIQESDVRREGKLKIVTPNLMLIEKNGVVAQPLTLRDSIEYVRDILHIGYLNAVRAVRKSAIFGSVQHVEVANTADPAFGDADYLLWLDTPGFNRFQWYFLSKGQPEKSKLNFDGAHWRGMSS